MLDIKLIRSTPDKIREGIKDRGGRYLPVLEELILRDKQYKASLSETETLRARKNELAAEINKLKGRKEEEAAGKAMKEAGEIKENMRKAEEKLSTVKKEVETLLLSLPNLPHESVVKGLTPEENRVVREHSSAKRQFSFKPLDHQSVGENLGILDFQTAGRLSGSRFALLKGMGARLERSLTQFMLDVHTRENGYTEIFPPFLVTGEILIGTGQLPKFEEDLYKVAVETPLYLIPTAEVPLTNMHRGETLKEKELPIKLTAYTACFRQEAGSYGKDTRGLIRNHQFNKVELVRFSRPEDSMSALEELTKDAEGILARLEIPYRVLELCTGDTGFASCKTYDLEVWMPGENRFREISSCSNCWDFQARRMNTRFKRDAGAPEFVHTLNGSGVAVGRAFAAILENYQNEDGSVSMPKALQPYMGTNIIKKDEV